VIEDTAEPGVPESVAASGVEELTPTSDLAASAVSASERQPGARPYVCNIAALINPRPKYVAPTSAVTKVELIAPVVGPASRAPVISKMSKMILEPCLRTK
jgi:hypothetical protein